MVTTMVAAIVAWGWTVVAFNPSNLWTCTQWTMTPNVRKQKNKKNKKPPISYALPARLTVRFPPPVTLRVVWSPIS